MPQSLKCIRILEWKRRRIYQKLHHIKSMLASDGSKIATKMCITPASPASRLTRDACRSSASQMRRRCTIGISRSNFWLRPCSRRGTSRVPTAPTSQDSVKSKNTLPSTQSVQCHCLLLCVSLIKQFFYHYNDWLISKIYAHQRLIVPKILILHKQKSDHTSGSICWTLRTHSSTSPNSRNCNRSVASAM